MEFDLHMCALQPNVSKEKARIFTRHIYGVLNESTCLARQTMALMPQISHLTRATKNKQRRYKVQANVAGASASASASAKPGNLKRDHKMANVGNKN